MTDESFLQETNKEIWCHLRKSLHAFLNLHYSQFCPLGEPFLSKSLFYLELTKSYLPIKPVFILNKTFKNKINRTLSRVVLDVIVILVHYCCSVVVILDVFSSFLLRFHIVLIKSVDPVLYKLKK